MPSDALRLAPLGLHARCPQVRSVWCEGLGSSFSLFVPRSHPLEGRLWLSTEFLEPPFDEILNIRTQK